MRPVRRRSMIPSADGNGANGAAANNSNTALSEYGEKDDSSSDYFSQCSDVVMSRGHRKQCSITVSVNGDFFNCVSDDEDEREEEDDGGLGGESGERVRGRGGGGKPAKGKVPLYLRSLWREMDQIMKELERTKTCEAIESQLSSSWLRLRSVVSYVQTCSPTRLPLVRSLVGNHGNDAVSTTPDDLDDSW